jgi:uncharacterized protein YxeA
MDKFLIDPPENITIDKVTVPQAESAESESAEYESTIPTGPPPVQEEIEPIQEEIEPIQEEIEPVQDEIEPVQDEIEPIQEEISIDDITVPQETGYVETGPPPPASSVIKDYLLPIYEPAKEPVDESLTGETLFPVTKEPIEEPVRFSLTRWILWILILVFFIVIAVYYSIKYAMNESGYLIKKNAKGYKISLDEMTSDVKKWLRGWVEGIQEWNENLSSKTNQFFFRQHVDKGTFKATKYKIPKNLIPKV